MVPCACKLINLTSLFTSKGYKQIFCIIINNNVNIKFLKMLWVMIIYYVIRHGSEFERVYFKESSNSLFQDSEKFKSMNLVSALSSIRKR